MELFEKLYELRHSSSISQEELAEKLGVSRQAVSKWESGAAQPELSKLIELSRLYQVSVDELLSLEHIKASEKDVPEKPEPMKEEKLSPREFCHRHRWALCVSAAALSLLIAVGFRCNHRINALSDQVDELRGQITSVQGNLSGQINDISNSVQDILQREASLVSQYDYSVTDIDFKRQECTLSFSLLPKAIPESLSVTIIVTDNDVPKFASEHPTRSVELMQDSFNIFRGSITLPLSNQLAVSACFDSGEETQIEQLDTIYDLKDENAPQLLEFYPQRAYSRYNSGSKLEDIGPWQLHFSLGDGAWEDTIGYFTLGALKVCTVRDAYIEYTSDGKSLAHVPLSAQRYEREKIFESELFFESANTENALVNGSGYVLFYAEAAKTLDFLLPLDVPVYCELVIELSDDTVLRVTTLWVKASTNGEFYEEKDYLEFGKPRSFTVLLPE